MLPATATRVAENTEPSVNETIQCQTEANIARFRSAGSAAIRRRLIELDHEWDIERYVETMAPSLTLMGIALGLSKNRLWFLLPLAVQAFFLQHALQGWCPPIPVLRRLGVRTTAEINYERNQLQQSLQQ